MAKNKKKEKVLQKQKQSQKVVVNINTETKAKRQYKRKPKNPSGDSSNNIPPKPPHQPQMIIHQQAYAPQPLIQTPTPQQFIPQVQPSSLHTSVAETQQQAQAPRSNGIERAPPPPPRAPTPPPQEGNEHPFVSQRRREPQKLNAGLLEDLKKKLEAPVPPHHLFAQQQQEQHSIIDYEHEPTILETRPIRAGQIQQVQNMVQHQNSVKEPAKEPAKEPTGIYLIRKREKPTDVKNGTYQFGNRDELRQKRLSMLEPKKPDLSEIHKALKKKHEEKNERDERYAMWAEEMNIPRYIVEEERHDPQLGYTAGLISPNPFLQPLKTPLGTSLDKKPAVIDLDLPDDESAKNLFPIFTKEVTPAKEHKTPEKKQEAEVPHVTSEKGKLKKYNEYQRWLRHNKTLKKDLQEQMTLHGLKYYYAKTDKEKKEVRGLKNKETMINELESKWKRDHNI
jgi:hypothetical protein